LSKVYEKQCTWTYTGQGQCKRFYVTKSATMVYAIILILFHILPTFIISYLFVQTF